MPLSIDVLPNELIGSIFKAGANIENEGRFPLRISLVNRLFRDVAHGTPDLWSHIIVDQDYSAKYLSLWVKRSRSCLLDITISSLLLSDASQALAESCARWRTLHMIGSEMDKVRAMLAPYKQASFPRLEYIQLHSRSSSLHHWNTQQDVLFVNAGSAPHAHSPMFASDLPSLTRSRLTRICMGCTAQTLLLSKRLTHLTVSHFSPTRELLANLFAESRLSTLVLDAFNVTDFSAPGEHFKASIDASSLNRLAIHFTDGHVSSGDCACCLSWLSMPNLQYIEVAYLYELPDLCNHFSVGSGTEYSQVQTFKMGMRSVSEEFCAAFPNVANLHLNHLSADGGVPKCCTQEGIWPKLKAVSVDVGAMGPIQTRKEWEAPLVSWVKSRRDLGYPLELVCITKGMWEEAIPLELDQLRVLVEVDIFDEKNWFLLRWAAGEDFHVDPDYSDSWDSDENDEDDWSDPENSDYYLAEDAAYWDAYDDDSFDAEEDGEFDDDVEEAEDDEAW